MRAAVDISMYPLTGDYRPPIQAFIDRLNNHAGLRVLAQASYDDEDWVASLGPTEVLRRDTDQTGCFLRPA